MSTTTTDTRSAIHLREARDVERPASDVWALVASYDRDPEWRRGVATMAPSQPGLVRVGLTTHEDLTFGGRRYRNDGRVLTVDDGRSFTWETTSGTRARGSRTVEPVSATTSRIVLTLEVEPSGAERLLAPVIRRMLGSQLRGDVERLITLLRAG